MKRLFLLLLAALMLLSTLCLSACSSSSDGEEDGYDGGYQGEVNVYNWGEYISPGDDGTIDVIAEFEKR